MINGPVKQRLVFSTGLRRSWLDLHDLIAFTGNLAQPYRGSDPAYRRLIFQWRYPVASCP
jgi:hypothetical protein